MNEQTDENINPQADTLSDLPVTGEQAEETKGGATRDSTPDIYIYQDYTNVG